MVKEKERHIETIYGGRWDTSLNSKWLVIVPSTDLIKLKLVFFPNEDKTIHITFHCSEEFKK